MKMVKWLFMMSTAALLAGAAYIYTGIYPMGADVPHNRITHWLLEALREQSIARAVVDIQAPDLNAAELLLLGGPDYNDMCAQCHLKPGRRQSDMSIGLYPSPPNLTLPEVERANSAPRQFWIIKHGIKASGMPAWGPTHDDQRIWAMVAFIQKLPSLTPEEYQILTTRAEVESNHH